MNAARTVKPANSELDAPSDAPSPATAAVLPVLKQLPSLHKRVLAALLDLCGVFHAHREQNRMSGRNLGIVMAPNLLACPGNDMAQTLQNTPVLNETVRWLIIDHKTVVDALDCRVAE